MPIDGADRRVAVLYAVGAVSLAAIAAMLCDPRLHLGPLSPSWPVVAGVVCALASAVTPLRRKAPGAAVVRAGCWLVAAGWVAYGYQFGIRQPSYWQAWAFGGLGLAMLAAVFATPTDLGIYPAVPPTAAPKPPARDEWAQRIEQGTKGRVAGAHSFAVERWESGCGYTVTGVLPPDGSTWEVLQPCQAGLAAVLRLPAGGGVTVGPHGDAAGFRLDVLTEDAMAESSAYPGLEE